MLGWYSYSRGDRGDIPIGALVGVATVVILAFTH